MEEKTGKTNFWLLGDNFLRGYYQTYDMTNKLIGLASSKFISNGSFSFNNTSVYIPKNQDRVNTLGVIKNDGKILGMEYQDFTIMIVVVCGGGSLLCITGIVCLYCCIRRRLQMKRLNQQNRPSNN